MENFNNEFLFIIAILFASAVQNAQGIIEVKAFHPCYGAPGYTGGDAFGWMGKSEYCANWEKAEEEQKALKKLPGDFLETCNSCKLDQAADTLDCFCAGRERDLGILKTNQHPTKLEQVSKYSAIHNGSGQLFGDLP